MNYKNNLKLPQSIISLLIFIFSAMSCAAYASFNPICNVNTISDENIEKPVIVSVFSDGKNPLPEQFNVKVAFDNEVFKKNAKIEYSSEISRNYKHNKSICGNEISVCCSLKNNKVAPTVPKNQNIFSLNLECKKHILKPGTELIITIENTSKKETINLPIKIQTSSLDKPLPIIASLTPSTGSLNPSFSPNITEYSLYVPYDTTNITFEHESSNDCSVKVNRHKLLSPGSVTDIYITVKTHQKGIQNVYHVSVNRELSDSKSESHKKSNRSGYNKKSDLFSSARHRKYDCTDKPCEPNEDSRSVKTIELQSNGDSTQNNKKIFSIIILSSVLVISAAYIFINRKKFSKIK